ncbi:MAG: hypothetical protein IKS29_00120 [Oscillospiraceae bacterium]|nr:hypothetical protein [Oscillospiraceae bacterium]
MNKRIAPILAACLIACMLCACTDMDTGRKDGNVSTSQDGRVNGSNDHAGNGTGSSGSSTGNSTGSNGSNHGTGTQTGDGTSADHNTVRPGSDDGGMHAYDEDRSDTQDALDDLHDTAKDAGSAVKRALR